MNVAQRILAGGKTETFPQAQALEAQIRELAMRTAAPNCADRIWTFYDNSTINKTRDGYKEGERV